MTFEEIVRFHGHQCPGLAIGYRMATAAMENLQSMRAEDEELVAIVENDACGVDALQCITGCTFGKGNLLFRDYGKQVYTVYSRSTRKGVRVRFHGKGIPEDLREDRSALARRSKRIDRLDIAFFRRQNAYGDKNIYFRTGTGENTQLHSLCILR